MFSYIAHCETSQEIWSALHNYFITESKVRVMILKNAVQTQKRGDLSVPDYMKKMKGISEALIASGK